MKRTTLLLVLVAVAIWAVFAYAEEAKMTAEAIAPIQYGDENSVLHIIIQYEISTPRYVEGYDGNQVRIADRKETVTIEQLEKQKASLLAELKKVEDKIAAIGAVDK